MMFRYEIIGYHLDRIDDVIVYDYTIDATAVRIIYVTEAQNEKADG